ncbi:FAD-binding oxidoreductase [Sphingosinicella microcystinivorans]|uniref:FAD-binding oxidoreductase n=1 Tax=Sphingosinicella microcystinivorans TaxID=335406 RepID=UPI0022F3ED85|nr:FAD-binding oxidoreductase [Sphingosinicella microcystinivorans]WBX86127.1 FAD-binding oxidoreductase [Sphingosinicella microcystinivorans]
MTYKVEVRYSDGASRTLAVGPAQTILDAAEEAGVPIVHACEAGVCGTCVGKCLSGQYEQGYSIGLSQPEKDIGRILACQTRAASDCVIAFDYPLADNAARVLSGTCAVTAVRRLSDNVVLLTLDISAFDGPFAAQPGQFAQLKVPGTSEWRSYSFTDVDFAGGEAEFLIRLQPGGVMSAYLERARPGDLVEMRGPKGGFWLRDVKRPIVLVAGGTGLSAVLAMAGQLVAGQVSVPVTLYYGVNEAPDLVLTDRLERLATANSNFRWKTIVSTPSSGWTGATGLVTDLFDADDFNGGNADVYLCGPAPMVEAARDWIETRKLAAANLYFEKFLPSARRQDAEDAKTPLAIPRPEELRTAGRGTALVIGGSIAGIVTAKALSEHYEKVIVLEKDQTHRRTEGRPGAAQGWHLHHLLIAGQREAEAVFPGIIDDMVAAGAFRVDMGEQYRILLAGSWKKVVRSGIDIVCAGRPLLEWCLRRRLDDEPAIDYRYEQAVRDLVFDPDSGSVLGAVTESGEVVAAELVVDAAGKNTPVPDILSRHGFPVPELEEDHISCFYSTMYHRVPADRVWNDKVMVLSYCYRPHQKYYGCQYYTDSSRTVMATTLVGYDCYDPPRNAQEFRAFADRMPTPVMGEELDHYEPCSPVYNFRYPTMQRYHYERLGRVPGGLIAVGDSLSSADPISGAGMTKALLEIGRLREALRTSDLRAPEAVRAYYQDVSGLEDLVWAVIREQNLRFPWIKDVEKKRPPFAKLQNWYIDRVMELMHDAPDVYRLYLSVTHFVSPPGVLMRPTVVARAIGKWLFTKLTFRKSLIERNFGKAPVA